MRRRLSVSEPVCSDNVREFRKTFPTRLPDRACNENRVIFSRQS